MENIFIIVSKKRVVSGHGQSDDIIKFATYGGFSNTQYPVFKNESDAREFMKDHAPNESNCGIMKFPVYNS